MNATNNSNKYSSAVDEQFSTILMDGNTPIVNDIPRMFIDPSTMENSSILFPFNGRSSGFNQEENYPPPFIYQKESVHRDPIPTYHGMSANIAPGPKRKRGRPPLKNKPRNQGEGEGQAEQNVNVSRISNKRHFHAASNQSPSIWNYTPYHKAWYQELTRPISSNIVTSSNMNMGLNENTGGGTSVEERIESLPKTWKQFQGGNELPNRCVLAGNFQSHKTNVIQDGTTDEQRLKLTLRNLPSWAVPNSNVTPPMMNNGTSLNAHVGSWIMGNQGSFYQTGSSSGSRTGIGFTTTTSNQANTNGMCSNDNPPISMLPMSYGSHYMHVSSIYRDWLKMGESTSIERSLDVPKESSLVVENNNRGKEPTTQENNKEENGVLEGYNCPLLVPEETSNENKQGSSTVPMPPSDESECYLNPLFWEDIDEFDFNSILTKNDMDTFFRD